MRSCTRDEFDAFLAAYPSKLRRGVNTIHDPPLVYWETEASEIVASYLVDNRSGKNVDSDWRIGRVLHSTTLTLTEVQPSAQFEEIRIDVFEVKRSDK